MNSKALKTQKRIPRYKGMTERSIAIQIEQNHNTKKKLTFQYQSLLLEKWMNNDFALYGRTMDLRELSEYLQMGMAEIMKSIGRIGRGIYGEDINQTYLGLVTHLIKNGLADRAQMVRQVEVLLASQGRKYQPFISSAVNDALRGQLGSNKGLVEILNLFKPLLKVQAANPTNAQQTNISVLGNGISQNEAVRIIEEQRQMDLLHPQNKPEAEKLIEANISPEYPEIIATRQQGFSLAKEGQLPSKVRKKKDHEDRNDNTIIIS